jgi:hypothetical protein
VTVFAGRYAASPGVFVASVVELVLDVRGVGGLEVDSVGDGDVVTEGRPELRAGVGAFCAVGVAGRSTPFGGSSLVLACLSRALPG